MIRPEFADTAAYGALFTDPVFWQPYVAAICAKHGLACRELRPGLPGTNAVFLVDQRYAVKLYPELFGGARSFPVERECYALIADAHTIPAPALIASGALFDTEGGWPWPYLITSVLPGLSLGESGALSTTDMLFLARWLGELLQRIHGLPLQQNLHLRADWGDFLTFLRQQRLQVVENHTRWAALPPHLIAQLDGYLPAADDLVDQALAPRLLHCDLNADHVLGQSIGGRWVPSGVIDFGDSKVGDPVYELVALHLGLFRANKTLLRACLAAYGDSSIMHDLPRRALAYTLLHEWTVIGDLREQLRNIVTLGELADALWNVETASTLYVPASSSP